MVISIGLVILGLILLVAGGELLLRGAVGVATLLNLTPAVIALTVVAAGTSVPELAVSLIAAVQGNSAISVANVVGSNSFNIAFILGLCAIVAPLAIGGNTIRLEYPVLALVTLVCVIFCRDGQVDRLEGAFMVSAYVGFTAYLVRLVRKQMKVGEVAALEAEIAEIKDILEKPPGTLRCAGLIAGGVTLLGLGAQSTVSGAVQIALALGLSERLVGLTIVAVGTGLPELVTSLISSFRGRHDVAIGNVIGSNIFNLLCVLGLTAVIRPLPVDAAILSSDNWWMLGITLLLFPLIFTGRRISRLEGVILLSVYLLYMTSLVRGAM